MVESRDAIKSSLKVQLEKYTRLVPVLSGVVFMLCTSILLVLRLMSDENADIGSVIADTLFVAVIVSLICFVALRLMVVHIQKAHIKSFGKKRELRLQRREEELAMRYRKLQSFDKTPAEKLKKKHHI
ncbi:MAG: hypothetical protein MK033_01080 [Candidatus Caenarcaniphilales bacterium]|nr:hypothetical protein [Candidatus Caenarcaniphilales bacterium]